MSTSPPPLREWARFSTSRARRSAATFLAVAATILVAAPAGLAAVGADRLEQAGPVARSSTIGTKAGRPKSKDAGEPRDADHGEHRGAKARAHDEGVDRFGLGTKHGAARPRRPTRPDPPSARPVSAGKAKGHSSAEKPRVDPPATPSSAALPDAALSLSPVPSPQQPTAPAAALVPLPVTPPPVPGREGAGAPGDGDAPARSIPLLSPPVGAGSSAPPDIGAGIGTVRSSGSSAVGALSRAPADSFAVPATSAEAAQSGLEPRDQDSSSPGSPVTRTVRDIVQVVPDTVKVAIAALAALSMMLAGGYLVTTLRARSLARQRGELLKEVGLLQTALLPPVPETLGALKTSVAYRPADGPGAGGDFYDALPLPGGRVALILGDVSGHGRQALAPTAFLRYTLRAYLEAGLEPRTALQVTARVIGDHLGADFATVILAVHDPSTGSLTYAAAGHPAPIVAGPSAHEPVLAASSPPIGIGLPTGLRQTTIPLPPGSVACLYTDGLTEARTERGLVGRGRLSDIVAEMGRQGTAAELLDRIASEARLVSDDMAACLVTPLPAATAGGFRTEQLELSAQDVEGPLACRFLDACGVSPDDARRAEREARENADRFGGAVLHVSFGNRRPQVQVLPRNVESIEAASRRAAAATG